MRGRKRQTPTDLPPRVHLRCGCYFFVYTTRGVREWVSLGRDRAHALETGAKLNDYVHLLQGKWLKDPTPLREMVYERDGYKCVYCGATEKLSLDHVLPIVAGGESTYENLVTACRSCNSRKCAARPGHEFSRSDGRR